MSSRCRKIKGRDLTLIIWALVANHVRLYKQRHKGVAVSVLELEELLRLVLRQDMFSWISSKLEPISLKLHSYLTRQLFYGIILGFSFSVTSTSLALYFQQRRQEVIQNRFEPRPIELRVDEVLDGVTGLIGMCLPRYW